MPIKPDREYRNLQIRAEENEPENEAKVVTGYASTFDEPYLLYDGEGWRLFEVVDRGAFDNTDMSDVIMQYDHVGRVFARTRNNTLEVETDDKGLFIKADLSGTEIGRTLRGDPRRLYGPYELRFYRSRRLRNARTDRGRRGDLHAPYYGRCQTL